MAVGWRQGLVPMNDPLDVSSLQFSDTGTALPDDAPDFRASSPDAEPASPPSPETPAPPRRRRLPGTGTGSQDTASRFTRNAKPPREPKPLPPIPPKGFAPGVEKMYHALALSVTPFDVKLGEVLHEIAAEAGQAWDELARQNHAVRRLLVALMETTAWGQVMAAHAPLMGLAVARMMGKDTRVSMVGLLMGQEAERFANNSGDDGTGNAAA